MESSGGAAAPGPKPKIIGLTGGIGSGKSSVANFIQELEYPVYFSDIRAKQIVNEDADLKVQIQSLLGPDSYAADGFYDRKYVANHVFEDKELLHQLNQIIHPAVSRDFNIWAENQVNVLIFKETALLFELHLEEQCDASVLVTAEDRLRLKRVMDRDGKTYREVEAIMENQLPEKDKIKKADYIIYNNDSLEVLRAETEATIELISKDMLQSDLNS